MHLKFICNNIVSLNRIRILVSSHSFNNKNDGVNERVRFIRSKFYMLERHNMLHGIPAGSQAEPSPSKDELEFEEEQNAALTSVDQH